MPLDDFTFHFEYGMCDHMDMPGTTARDLSNEQLEHLAACASGPSD